MAISFALLWTVKFNRWASLCLSGTRLKIQMGPLSKSKGTTNYKERWKGASTGCRMVGRLRPVRIVRKRGVVLCPSGLDAQAVGANTAIHAYGTSEPAARVRILGI